MNHLSKSFQSMDENEEKLLKADQEVHSLRVEESKLRQENLQLKVNFIFTIFNSQKNLKALNLWSIFFVLLKF